MVNYRVGKWNVPRTVQIYLKQAFACIINAPELHFSRPTIDYIKEIVIVSICKFAAAQNENGYGAM